VVAAVDATKFGRVAFVEICPLGRPDVIVIDRPAEPEGTALLRSTARELIVAQES